MKHVFYSLIIASTLFACSSSSNDSANSDNEIIQEKELEVSNYSLDIEKSSMNWKRFLDQKATQKKMKLFGKEIDVKMGPVTLDMSGNVLAQRGGFLTTDGEPTSGQVIFNMSTFKFAEEKGKGLFNTKDFPESELKFLSFSKLENDSLNNYLAKASVTIQDKTMNYDLPTQLTIDNSSGVTLQSTLVINTLDFPLRENAKKEEVNKDEITVALDLSFNKK